MWTPIPSLRFALAAATAAGALAAASGPTSAQEAAPALEAKLEPPAAVAPQQVDPTLTARMAAATTVVLPGFARQPAAEFPDRAFADGISEGAVTLKCVAETTGWVSGCEIVAESPAGAGFGQAAVTSMRRARIRPLMIDGATEPSFIQFTLRFGMEPEPEPVPLVAILENPTWRVPPRTAVPNRARAAGINRAQALLDCEIFHDTLRACVVKQEDPTGYGFGAAAVGAAYSAEISWEDALRAAPGAHAVFTVYFESP
jgi:TonB family protein